MIGVLLIILAIALYISGNKKWSILLFACFSYQGFVVLTDSVIGLKNQDAALIYFVVISIYSYFFESKLPYVKNSFLEKTFICFGVFMTLSILYSAIRYNLNAYQIIQGSRRYFIIFSYYFIRKMSVKDVYWVTKRIVVICVFTSVLYIIQSLTGLPTLPDGDIALSDDSIDGVLRYYNYPPALPMTIFILLFNPQIIGKKKSLISLLVLFVAMMCTQTRSLVLGVAFAFLIGMLLSGRVKKMIGLSIVIFLLLIPFSPYIMARLGENGSSPSKSTSGDIEAVMNGDFVDYSGGDGGTMLFRLALVAERVDYLLNSSAGDIVFGMGLLSDQQKALVDKMYHFNIGLRDKENGGVGQLSTPDIAYGNLVCKLGIVGMFIYLAIWGFLLVWSYVHRKDNIYSLCLFCLSMTYFFTSFTGATISYAEYSVIPFILYVAASKQRCTES